MPSSPNNS